GYIEPLGIDIERVRVLHDELANAQQPGLRPLLIAEFGLDLIPDLRQLFVAAQLAARNRRYYFFVRHPEAKIASEAIPEPEHVISHDVPAARFLPELSRIECREQ